MALGPDGLGGGPPRREQALYVIAMALALVLAAVIGAAAGLVWQSSGFEDEVEEDEGEAQADAG